MTVSARRLAFAVFLSSLAIVSWTSDVFANPLAGLEVGARQAAVRVLDRLKPIEDLVESTTVVAPSMTKTETFVEVTGSRVNLRSAPNLSSEVIRVALEGEVFPSEGEEGEWYRLRTDDGRTAYIARSYSRLNKVPVRTAEQPEQAERLRSGTEKRAGQILGDCRSGVATLGHLTQTAEDAFKREYGQVTGTDNADRLAAENSLRKIQKYNRIVSEKYNRYAQLAGADAIQPGTAASARQAAQVRGTIRAGLGANSAKTEVVGTGSDKTDVTRAETAADVTAYLSPNDVLGLQAGYEKEIRFAPSSRTRASLKYDRKLGSKARLGARAGLDNYADEANDLNDINRTRFGVNGSIAPSPQFRANADLDIVGASHPNDDTRDYRDMRVGIGAQGEASPTVSWGGSFAHVSHDLDDNTAVEDNARDQLRGNVNFKTSDRSSVSIVGASETFSFDSGNNPGNYAKRSIGLLLQHRGRPGKSTTWLFEIENKGYDVDEDRQYTELRGEVNSRNLANVRMPQRSQIAVNYRNYKATNNASYLDYVEGRWDVAHSRGGIFYESNNYVQYFFDSEDAQRNARVSQFFWLGLLFGPQHAVQIGPHVAANTELVTIDGTDMGVFESPNNTLRYGVKGAVRIDESPVRVSGRGRWETLNFYNVDGADSPTRFELEGDAAYEVSRFVDATAHLKYYSTGSDAVGATQISEFDILFGLIYIIGGRR